MVAKQHNTSTLHQRSDNKPHGSPFCQFVVCLDIQFPPSVTSFRMAVSRPIVCPAQVKTPHVGDNSYTTKLTL